MTTKTKDTRRYIKPPHRFIEKLPLHKNQQIIWDAYFSGKYRALVINAGRRFGKSTVSMAIAIELAVNYGKKVWWVGKTYRDAGKQWRDAKQLLNGIYTSKSEQDRRMEFYYTLPNGKELRGELVFRSADTPDNLRGDGLNLLILDEAAFQSPEVWKVLRPALTDQKGDVIFISTPNGHNFFYSFFERGREENRDKYPRWWSHHFTSFDNPLVDPEEINAAKDDMTETEFRVEHLAEFIDDIGKVFSNVYANATADMMEVPDVRGQFVMGIDLARKHDATVVTIVDADTMKQVFGIRYVGQDWDLQKAKIAAIIHAWNPGIITADATAVGQPVVEDLQKLVPHNPITPFILTSITKPPIIQKLAVMMQNKKIEILNPNTDFGKIQINELLAYEIKKSKNEMRWVYGAPQGGKDDTVIALALAISGITGKAKVLQSTTNPFYSKPKPVPSYEKRKTVGSEYKRRSHEAKVKLLESVKNG